MSRIFYGKSNAVDYNGNWEIFLAAHKLTFLHEARYSDDILRHACRVFSQYTTL